MRGTKLRVLLVGLLVVANACSRQESEGQLVVQVEDFRALQPLALMDAEQRANLAPPASAAGQGTVFLVEGATDYSRLALVPTREKAAVKKDVDVDGASTFSQVEGQQVAVVDVNGDGVADTVVTDMQAGSTGQASITHINQRSDGTLLWSTNDSNKYEHGDTVAIRVRGYMAVTEEVTVQIWIARNGGFLYWESEPRSLYGDVDYTVYHTIPLEWPATNDADGSAYFSYPATAAGVFNGDNFVLQGKKDAGSDDEDTDAGGDPPVDGAVVIAEGATVVSAATVPLAYTATGAEFVRFANDASVLQVVPWVPMGDGLQEDWLLADGEDGARAVYAQFANAYGTTGPVVHDTIELDTTAIQILDFATNQTLYRAGQTLRVSYSLSEAPVGEHTLQLWGNTYTPDCEDLVCSFARTLLGSEPEGTQQISVSVEDRAGWTDAAAVNVVLDFTPPETVWDSGLPAGSLTVSDVTLRFGSNEPGSFFCAVDGGGYQACSSPWALHGLTDGTHGASVYAIDLAGNVDASPVTATWTVDTLNPDTVIALAPAALVATDTVSFQFTSPAADVSHFKCNLDAVGWFICPAAYSPSGLTDSAHHLEVRAVDQFGNVDPSPATHDWTVDTVAPETMLTTKPPACSADLDSNFLFESDDDTALFTCDEGGGGFACSSPRMYPAQPEGDFSLTVQAYDAAGNADATPASWAWKVDRSAPAAPNAAAFTVTSNATGIDDILTGAAGAAEPGTYLHVYYEAGLFYLATSAPVNDDGSVTTFPVGDNVGDFSQQMYVTTVDCAGNESPAIALRNPWFPPRITPSLVTLELVVDAYGNNIGNPEDVIRITWDNSPTGDANDIVAEVRMWVPELAIGPMLVTATAGYYTTDVVIPAGTFDGSVHAEVQAVGEANLTSNIVASAGTISVDNEAPAAPTGLLAGATANIIETSWNASSATDVTGYVVYRGLTDAIDEYWSTVTVTSFSGNVTSCLSYYVAAIAVDDAGNSSDPITSGNAIDTTLEVPDASVWGGVYSVHVNLKNADEAITATELHFMPSTLVTDPPPWSWSVSGGASSPYLLAGNGKHEATGFEGGTWYSLALRNKVAACESEFSTPVSVRTLGVAGMVAGAASGICCSGPGVTYVTYFGGLGFAVAGVGDIIGADGKEDILTGVPGDTTALLVSGYDLTHTSIFSNYYISTDIVGAGPSMASAGDVNKDGTPDYMIGSPLESADGKNLAGVVRVYSGTTTTFPLYSVTGEVAGRQLGYATSGLGDINGDLHDDFLAGGFGCMRYDCGGSGSQAGKVVVYSGIDGSVLREHEGPDAGGFFGVAVDGGADINNDGVNDYVVGAPGHLGANPTVGNVYVYSGASGSLLFSVAGTDSTYRFGTSVRVVKGFFNGSTAGYVVVGSVSRQADVAGKVQVYDQTGSLRYEIDGAEVVASENFGMALAAGGDMDGDGLYDIVVGDPNVPLASVYGNGKAYIFDQFSGDTRYEISGGELDGALGFALDYIEDTNADGIDDVLVGSPGAQVDGVYSAGRIYTITVKPE